MRTLLAAVACLTIACASNVDPATVREHADLVFLSGAVYTVDPQRPWAEAIAVRGGRIVAVGSNSEVRPYVGDDTRVVDLDGRMLLPGFHDAHLHPRLRGARRPGVLARRPDLGGGPPCEVVRVRGVGGRD